MNSPEHNHYISLYDISLFITLLMVLMMVVWNYIIDGYTIYKIILILW